MQEIKYRNILLYGYYTEGNFGDYLILLSLIEFFKELKHLKVTIYYLGEKVPSLNNLQANFIRKSKTLSTFRTLLKQIILADAVVIGGGQKYCWGYKRGIAPQLLLPLVAKILGKKVFFISIGVEPSDNPLWRAILKNLL